VNLDSERDATGRFVKGDHSCVLQCPLCALGLDFRSFPENRGSDSHAGRSFLNRHFEVV
jgi:hypothetical protein